MSNSLQPHRLHAKLPCPSPTPGACSNSCPPSQWCHPTFTSSVVPFSSCLQSFPASGSFLMSQPFTSGGQSTRASAPVLPMNIQDLFPLGLTGLISLQSKGHSRVFSNITVQKHQFFGAQLSLWSKSHIHTWLLEKSISVVQSLSHVWLFVTPWTAARQASLSFTINWSLSWWCHPTISSSVIPISSCLQSFPASGSFKWVSSPHQVAKVLKF